MTDYGQPLREQDAKADPFSQFAGWFGDAQMAGERMPEAVALATASADAVPSVRMVLVKRFDEEGFVFFSNHDSRKGRELAANPRAALVFYWDALGRQVRVSGPVARVSAVETLDYVRSRPRASQLSALASPQSQVLESREALEVGVAELEQRYPSGELPAPVAWGGYRLAPHSFEFWQQRHDRLHDRLSYRRRDGGGWSIVRLAP
ncbi:MAG TPA: pyridoxamine 5'-phosphate oxidase [Solirubrobacteraceae bacterium]|nr:pyridoxamine 5'-phosphate oxidase [Solirubrobacteraceae bacterium]